MRVLTTCARIINRLQHPHVLASRLAPAPGTRPCCPAAQALEETCRDIGYKVTTVATGEEALDRIYAQNADHTAHATSKFELVLCDVELPNLPGVEVLKQLRANDAHHDLSVIMLATEMSGQAAEMIERCASLPP